MGEDRKYSTFWSFYPYYLTEHSNKKNRLLHFLGTAFLLIALLIGLFTGKIFFFIIIPFLGYGFAWVGHFFIEKNKPATFTYPFYSLASDFVMFWHMLSGQIKNEMEKAKQLIKN
jgi:hypothetical protein